jgi:hypothetical protein
MDFDDIKKISKSSTLNTSKPSVKNYFLNPLSFLIPGLSNNNNSYSHLGFKKMGTLYRFLSSTIDSTIANVIRLTTLFIVSKVYISKVSLIAIEDKMGIKLTNPPSFKIDAQFVSSYVHALNDSGYLTNVILLIFLSFLSGSLYYILIPLRKSSTTVAGQLLDFVIVKKSDLSSISFFRCLSRYLCCFIPVFIGVCISLFVLNTLYFKTLIMSIGFCYFIWFDIAPTMLFNGQSLSDKICGTIVLRKTLKK